MLSNGELRRTRLVVPTPELLKIEGECTAVLGGTGSNRSHKVLCGGSGAIKAAHILRHALHKPLMSEQGMQHANHLCTFLIDRGCIKIIDRLIFTGLDRMSRRASIFAELRIPQHRHIFNALHSRRMQICRKALIAEDGQAFLQRELKPITAGDSISRPIMKVLMGDHALHTLKLTIGGRFGIGKNKL